MDLKRVRGVDTEWESDSTTCGLLSDRSPFSDRLDGRLVRCISKSTKVGTNEAKDFFLGKGVGNSGPSKVQYRNKDNAIKRGTKFREGVRGTL